LAYVSLRQGFYSSGSRPLETHCGTFCLGSRTPEAVESQGGPRDRKIFTPQNPKDPFLVSYMNDTYLSTEIS